MSRLVRLPGRTGSIWVNPDAVDLVESKDGGESRVFMRAAGSAARGFTEVPLPVEEVAARLGEVPA